MTSWFGRLRVAARIARRQVRRTLRSSVLVVLMVALPVGAMGAVSIVADSTLGTLAQRLDVELGQTEGYLAVTSILDPTLRQHPTLAQRWRVDERVTTPETAEEDTFVPGPRNPAFAVPAGTRLLPVSTPTRVQLETAGGRGGMDVIVGEVWDPSFSGRFDVVSGTPPTAADGVMATAAALERLGAEVGDIVTLIDPALTARVTGIMAFAAEPDSKELLFFPWDYAERFSVYPYETRWYLPDLSLSWPDIQKLNPQGVTAYSRVVVEDPPPVNTDDFGEGEDEYWRAMFGVLLILGAGAVFAAYQVALLAGAAFAVSARRQRQSLATLASVGAAPTDIRRTVLLQGTVLGLAGGVIGIAAGAGVAWVFMLMTDAVTGNPYWGYNVPWWLLAVILVFAVTVGTLSALLPARHAAASDVLQALRGARKPQIVTRTRPLWGSILLLLGITLTVVGVIGAVAVAAQPESTIPSGSLMRMLPYLGVIAGPILVQIGVIIAGGWILHVLSRGLSRLGLGARLASRDAAANAARSVPAFAAIAAAVFLGVFALNMIGASFAQNDRTYVYSAPLGSVYGTLWATSAENTPDPEGLEQARVLLSTELRAAGAHSVGVIYRPDAYEGYNITPENAEGMLLPMTSYPEKVLCSLDNADFTAAVASCDLEYLDFEGSVTVAEPDDLETLLGMTLPDATLRAFAAGTALVTKPLLIDEGKIALGFWPISEMWGRGDVSGPSQFTQAREQAQAWREIPATAITGPRNQFIAILSPTAAAELGITTAPRFVIGAFAQPPSTATFDAINYVGMTTENVSFGAALERGADQPWLWYLLITGVAVILVLGASAVSIGLARFDGRADDATLAAVGGDNSIRRRISFWQAIVIVGVGSWTGALTALLPSWGFVHTGASLRLEDFPWLILGGIVIVLPLAVAVVAWLISPRPAVLTRRTAIA